VHERAGLDRVTALRTAAARGGRPDDPDKEDGLDVALWQRAEPGEPAWDSPWGPGRPGWHAECTAMALATLGPAVDLHGGGADLAFPHHAYESAQAEAVTGVTPFARAWLHVGTVLYRGEKIAKSTGNLVFAHELLERHPAEAIRLLITDRRFRDPWEFEEDALSAASARVERLRGRASRTGGPDTASAEGAALDALTHDLDAVRALAIAEDAGGAALRTIGGILGVV
jgi:cysteinyl-tRNA synthetase